MSYKSEMNKLKENRKKYFPLMEMLLYVESKTEKRDLPAEMTDISQIAIIMELMDIGYINKEAFIINKHRQDVTGVFYSGGYPLTDAGIRVYRQHLHEKRGEFIRGLALAVFVFLAVVVFLIILK